MRGAERVILPAMPGEIGAGPSPRFALPLCVDTADVVVAVAALSEVPTRSALALLNRAELERVQSITCRDYRLHVVKARALLRLMLAGLAATSPESFEIDEGGGARPRLRVNPWGLHFSVSHSGDRIAVAIATTPVGIDIERVAADCDWQAVAETCFHRLETERLRMRAVSGPAAREAFFEIWTRKEAYLKAIGSALDTDPTAFSTVGCDGAVLTDACDAGAGKWYTQSVAAPAGYKAALAGRRQRSRLLHCRLDGALVRRGMPHRPGEGAASVVELVG